MFVKQITVPELAEYERALEGTILAVKQLSANDQEGINNVVAVIDACEVLQEQIRKQIAGDHEQVTDMSIPNQPSED